MEEDIPLVAVDQMIKLFLTYTDIQANTQTL